MRIGVALAAVLAALLACAAPAAADTATFNFTGAEQSFAVPAGVFSVDVTAIGGHGADRSGVTGGRGASVSGTLPVRPGQVLYVEVGGSGADATPNGVGGFNGGVGGFNGGGAGGSLVNGGGGGGGASDVRTVPMGAGATSLNSRAIVAGAGGGGGQQAGGDAGSDGASGTAGGGAGTQTGGGSAGGTGDPGTAGTPRRRRHQRVAARAEEAGADSSEAEVAVPPEARTAAVAADRRWCRRAAQAPSRPLPPRRRCRSATRRPVLPAAEQRLRHRRRRRSPRWGRPTRCSSSGAPRPRSPAALPPHVISRARCSPSASTRQQQSGSRSRPRPAAGASAESARPSRARCATSHAAPARSDRDPDPHRPCRAQQGRVHRPHSRQGAQARPLHGRRHRHRHRRRVAPAKSRFHDRQALTPPTRRPSDNRQPPRRWLLPTARNSKQ